jgi:hypothetical protein
MTFLLVIIVILFVIFLVIGGIVIPLLGAIDQFRHRGPSREKEARPPECSRNGITFLMAVPGMSVRLDRGPGGGPQWSACPATTSLTVSLMPGAR